MLCMVYLTGADILHGARDMRNNLKFLISLTERKLEIQNASCSLDEINPTHDFPSQYFRLTYQINRNVSQFFQCIIALYRWICESLNLVYIRKFHWFHFLAFRV